MHNSLEMRQIEGPPLAARHWRLSNPFRIGRASSNELELPDPGVSRRHASIEHDDYASLVRD
jgi:pSer/pThr/pTyr-binding forkhead associated (FHA) protein